MTLMKHILAPVSLAAALLVAGQAHATITVYTTQATFLTAVGSPVGVDTFNDLDFTQPLTTPQPRVAGAYTYTASSGPLSTFFPAGDSAADIWLATNDRTDTITLDSFSAGVNALGGFFFRSNALGTSSSSAATINIKITDASGTFTQAQVNPGTTTFVGFISDSLITSVQIYVGAQGVGTAAVWPTLNDLTLGTVSAVPEPGTYGMLLAGVGLVGWLARRRNA